MNGYDRTWPTAMAAIGVGALMGWAVLGPRSHTVETELRFHDIDPTETIRVSPHERGPVSEARPDAPDGVEGVLGYRPLSLDAVAALDTDGLLEIIRTGEHSIDRRNAAVLLGAADPATVLGALMITMRTDPSPEVRLKCAESLGVLGRRDAIGPLQLAATLDGDVSVREAAVAALADVGQAEAIPMLLDIFSNEGSEYVRAQAIRGLIEIGDKEVWDGMASLLRHERSAVVARAAGEARREVRGARR